MNTCPEPHVMIDATYGIPTPADAHMASCARCQAELAELAGVRAALADLPPARSRPLDLSFARRRTLPYGAIAAAVLILVTFLIGLRFEIRADGSWMLHIGIVRVEEAPASVTPTVDPAKVEEAFLRMQQDQLAAIARMIRDSKESQNAEFGALLGEYATLSESRRTLDYELIQMELDDLRARTDDHLYKTNLVMYQLLSQLSQSTPQTD